MRLAEVLRVGDESQFLARLFEQTAMPFGMFDFQGRIVRVNPALEELTGYRADELLGMTVLDLASAGTRVATAEGLARLAETGHAQRYEKECLRKDGRVVPVEVIADAYRDERGEVLGFSVFVLDLTDRARAERALRESETRFRFLYDEAPFGYNETDAEGVIVTINRTECELLGYTREELLGRPCFDVVAEEERDEMRRSLVETVQGWRPPRPAERTYLTKDGRRLIVAIENRLRHDDQGRIVGLRRTVQDITARKQTEAALVASERRARALFEGIEDAIFVHDLHGRILDVNPAACRRLGYSRDELLRLTTRDIDDPDFASGYHDRLGRQLQQGHLSIEGRHRSKDGRILPVEINSSMIQYEGQQAVLAVMRDISERKALEEARRFLDEEQIRNARALEAKNRELTHSEARYRQLTEGCLDAVVVADARGRITLFNPSAERTFGYAAGDVLGRPITLLMPEDSRGRPDEGFARDLETRHPRLVGRTVELRGRRKDGSEFPMELSLNAVDVEGEVQFIGSIRDQDERHRMRAMLVQSEKLASIGLLSAGVAHEINNPLAYIGNNLAVLERDLKGILAMMAGYESAHDRLAAAAPEVLAQVQALSDDLDWPYVRDNLSRMITRTRDGVQRVATIVQNLRGLARASPSKLEDASLPDLLAPALEMVQGRIRRCSIELVVDVAPGLPNIPCVASQISQVLLNLLVNAVQAIEESNRPGGNRLRLAIRPDGDFLAVEVEDTGRGIDPEHLPRLFDPFFTTKPAGEGTGLGLSISHGIVTGHGGRIEVQSRPGHGTCFRVLLPKQAPRTSSEPRKPHDGGAEP